VFARSRACAARRPHRPRWRSPRSRPPPRGTVGTARSLRLVVAQKLADAPVGEGEGLQREVQGDMTTAGPRHDTVDAVHHPLAAGQPGHMSSGASVFGVRRSAKSSSARRTRARPSSSSARTPSPARMTLSSTARGCVGRPNPSDMRYCTAGWTANASASPTHARPTGAQADAIVTTGPVSARADRSGHQWPGGARPATLTMPTSRATRPRTVRITRHQRGFPISHPMPIQSTRSLTTRGFVSQHRFRE
jgi:hypothetical protein